MSWPNDILGSGPSQGSDDSFGGSDTDQAVRDHDEALAELRADRKLTQLLASQQAGVHPLSSIRARRFLLAEPMPGSRVCTGFTTCRMWPFRFNS